MTSDAEKEQAIYALQAKRVQVARDGWVSIEQGAARWRKGNEYLNDACEPIDPPAIPEPSLLDRALEKVNAMSEDELTKFVEGRKKRKPAEPDLIADDEAA